MRTALAVSSALYLVTGFSASAEDFSPVREQSTFVDLIEDRKLTRFGIELTVTPTGAIEGEAFGWPVTGAWRWDGGYFCRDLYWGGKDLGPNCQEVRVSGDTLRFIADQGSGQSADLRLR